MGLNAKKTKKKQKNRDCLGLTETRIRRNVVSESKLDDDRMSRIFINNGGLRRRGTAQAKKNNTTSNSAPVARSVKNNSNKNNNNNNNNNNSNNSNNNINNGGNSRNNLRRHVWPVSSTYVGAPLTSILGVPTNVNNSNNSTNGNNRNNRNNGRAQSRSNANESPNELYGILAGLRKDNTKNNK